MMTTAPASLHQPSLRDLFGLDVPYGTKVSPAGSKVAVWIQRTNWKEDRYDTRCLIHDVKSGCAYPLNQAGGILQAEWLDENTLAVIKEGSGKGDAPEAKNQIWLYEGLVGDGWMVTEAKSGVESFKPFAGGFLYLAADPEREEKKARKDRFGQFAHFEQEDSASALYYTGLEELRHYQAQARLATEDEAKELIRPVIQLSKLLEQPLKIEWFVHSPAGEAVYLNCRQRDDLVYFRKSIVYCLQTDVKAALAEYLKLEKEKKDKKKEAGKGAEDKQQETEEEKEDLSYLGCMTRLNVPRGGRVTAVAPDGKQLLISYKKRDDMMFTRTDLWTIDARAALVAADAEAFLGQMRDISSALDEALMDTYWVESGIFGLYVNSTVQRLAKFHGDGSFSVLDFQTPQDQVIFPLSGFHISRSGHITLVAANASLFPEAYLVQPAEAGKAWVAQPLTTYGQAVAGWDLGTVETIRWKSRDGVEIEGVLRKPSNFDPAKKYPLVFVVHGGPTWYSGEYWVTGEDLRYYPAIQFTNKDVLVLKPNYRGSVGRGQAFMELNVDNLGVGDLWDLESAIDHLSGLGWVDPERVGCMGWSQGGYISAFAGLQSQRFKAVSVGAGISDWYTYHISNDIPDFTTDFLSGSPFRDRSMYVKTAPISNLANAKTPMLIQHGSDDHRVPLSNATELYRGLKEMGVPVELFVYPGFGHPITKPRENHAVLHQNLAWFSHYLLGEALELL
jgi:dipeptidyl aminopeptidase/acylaminoacyl peptidase